MTEHELVKKLIAQNLHITTAESCTGGMIASKIVNVPDASRVFNGAFVTYSDEVKTQLIDVPKELIETFGVVSEPVAKAMADGAAKKLNANAAISVTGVAGPGGGTRELPVGTICFGFCLNGDCITETRLFSGDRQAVREQATDYGIRKMTELLSNSCLNHYLSNHIPKSNYQDPSNLFKI